MKKLIVLLCLFCFSFSLFSQDIINETSATEYNRQIGINSTALISQLINFSSEFSAFNDQYIFTFKKFKGKHAFRLGFGGFGSYSKSDDLTNSNFRVNLRLGREGFTDIGKRWRVYYGLDSKISIERSKFSFFEDPTTFVSIGGGPVCGLQLNINSRLSIATEASYNLALFREKQNDDTTTGLNTSFEVPDFFNLNFDF